MERISWDDYFMVQALWARVRSPDDSTKHGCLVINSKNQIVSFGFNGYPRGCKDELMPQDRPAKYDFFIHAENSAILNSNLSNLDKCTVYVTGPPCIKCLGLLIQVGIKKIIYGPIVSYNKDSICKSNPEQDIQKYQLINNDIEIIKWEPNNIELIFKFLMNIKELVFSCDMVKSV